MSWENPKEDILYTLMLTRIKTITPYDVKKLLDGFSNSSDIFQSGRDQLIKILEPRKNVAALSEAILTTGDKAWAEKEMIEAEKHQVKICCYHDPSYPKMLKQIPDSPAVLYIYGDLLPQDDLSIGVVGTRNASSYGILAAGSLVRDLAEYGITIVSGMARGIDTTAHKEALAAGGRTIAVMGTGIDITYPAENIKLKEQIRNHGAVITEFPFGSPPSKYSFPVRNRIISGLSLGCLVVEAPEKSGALITARMCTDYNREVFAVPGNITSGRSKGCNSLIREGAKPVTCANDILEELNLPLLTQEKPDPLINLTSDERQIMKIIADEEISAEMIIQKCDLPSYKVNGILTRLEIAGLLKRFPGGKFVKQHSL